MTEPLKDVQVNFVRGEMPSEGDTIVGFVEHSDWGPKFKRDRNEGAPFTILSFATPPRQWSAHNKDWDSYKCEIQAGQGATPPKPAGGSQRPSNGSNRDAYWERKEARDIASEPRIARAHAQEMALRWARVLVEADKLLPEDLNLERLVEIIDFFVEDSQSAIPKDSGPQEVSYQTPPAGEAATAGGEGAVVPARKPAESGGITSRIRKEVEAAYRSYVAAASDGPTAKNKVRAFLNANQIESFETMTGPQASLLLDFLTDAENQELDASIPF